METRTITLRITDHRAQAAEVASDLIAAAIARMVASSAVLRVYTDVQERQR